VSPQESGAKRNVLVGGILRRLVRRFGLIAVLTLLGVIAGATYGALATPTYRAQAYVVVTADAGEGPMALNFAQAYGRVATTGPVAEKAAKTLGSTEGLNVVTASTSPDAPVIEITATGTDAKRTAAVANAVAQALVDFGGTRKAETRVGLAMLAAAAIPTSPSSPKPPLELAIGGAGGLLIGGLAALAGVGRASSRTADRAASRVAEAEVAQAEVAQAEAASVPGQYQVAQFPPPPPALTVSYSEPQPVFDAGTDEKIVGRAVVIYRESK
jgi:capsular polysaccharide biosynthesis protein